MMARFPKTLRSTQKASHSLTEGLLPAAGTTGFDREAPRPAKMERLSPTTIGRKRLNPHPVARFFTRFTTNYRGQVRIPHNLMSEDRFSLTGRDPSGERGIDVGEMPED
jgi:hypothetical protein